MVSRVVCHALIDVRCVVCVKCCCVFVGWLFIACCLLYARYVYVGCSLLVVRCVLFVVFMYAVSLYVYQLLRSDCCLFVVRCVVFGLCCVLN